MRAVSFTVGLTGSEVEYEPRRGVDVLPDFLHEGIAFETSQAPLFLNKVICALNPEVAEAVEDSDDEY